MGKNIAGIPAACALTAALASLLVAPCRGAAAPARPQGDRPPLSGLVQQKYAPRREGRAAMNSVAAKAIAAGLDWLERHREPAGHWDADGFMRHDREGTACDGPGHPVHDVGITGLALLAFLADCDSMTLGRHERVLGDGVKWLRGQQGENGLFGTNTQTHFIYGHAIATLAMVEVAALADDPVLRRSAQRGIDYLEAHRNPYSVWRYHPRDNDNDTSVTGWCIMAYTSADALGLEVNAEALKLCEVWLDHVTDPDGRHGYGKQGEPSGRLPGDHGTRFPVEKGEALTALGLQCRYFLGQDPEQRPVMTAATKLIVDRLPEWNERNGAIDLYYWYAASQALYQVGGRPWSTWQRALFRALLPAQRTDGNFAGSWDPISVWGEIGGRVYSTAMAVLSLEAEYRYARLLTLAPLPDRHPYREANRHWTTRRFAKFAERLDALAAEPEASAADPDAIAAARVALADAERKATAQIESLRKQRAWFGGPEELDRLAQEFGELPPGVAARALHDEWRQDPQFKREVLAMERYEKLAEQADRAQSERSRNKVRRDLESFLRLNEGTRAAERAQQLLDRLRR